MGPDPTCQLPDQLLLHASSDLAAPLRDQWILPGRVSRLPCLKDILGVQTKPWEARTACTSGVDSHDFKTSEVLNQFHLS